MASRGSLVTALGSGVPSKPTRSTSAPLRASARAWYSMRAERPKSPSATTAALMWKRGVEGGSILPLGKHPRQQVDGDSTAVIRARSHVVDRCDLVAERPLCFLDRCSPGKSGFGQPRTHDGRRNTAESDARVTRVDDCRD